jgi:hydrogenase-4 membrane subunit HyfE
MMFRKTKLTLVKHAPKKKSHNAEHFIRYANLCTTIGTCGIATFLNNYINLKFLIATGINLRSCPFPYFFMYIGCFFCASFLVSPVLEYIIHYIRINSHITMVLFFKK